MVSSFLAFGVVHELAVDSASRDKNVEWPHQNRYFQVWVIQVFQMDAHNQSNQENAESEGHRMGYGQTVTLSNDSEKTEIVPKQRSQKQISYGHLTRI